LWLIQRAGRNGDSLAAFFLEEEIGSAFAAEAAPKTWNGDIPFECLSAHNPERRTPAGRGSSKVTAGSPALNAVAGDHVAQLASYLIADPTTLTAARDYLTHQAYLHASPKCSLLWRPFRDQSSENYLV
jgi:hypothetical protein